MTVQQFVQRDSADLITAVREGLAFESFVELRDALELSTNELTQLLGIPRRTLSKRQTDGVFKLTESNALSRIARVYKKALNLFDSEVDALRWLKTPSPALGATPLDLLDTDPGADAVSTLLTQLAWGVYP